MSPTESQPLLGGATQDQDNQDDNQSDSTYFDQLDSEPWYKRPSAYHLLPWIFLVTIELNLFAPLTINQLLGLVCRQTYNEPLMFDSEKCQTIQVQTQLSQFLGWSNLIGGLAGLYIGPKLCANSDLRGRKFWFLVCHGSIALGLLTNVVGYQLWRYLDYHWLLVGCLLEGFAQPTVLMALITAYINDCTRVEQRTQRLSWTFATFTIGGTIGPALGSAVEAATNSIVTPYYLVIASISVSTMAMYFVLPESIDKDIQHKAKEVSSAQKLCNKDRSVGNVLHELNLLQPLKDIWAISQLSPRPRNVILLVLIDTLYIVLTAGVSSVMILYLQHVFQFSVTDIGLMLSGMALVQTLSLLLIPPLISRWHGTNGTKSGSVHLDFKDIFVIRVCSVLETLSVLFLGLARSGQSAITSSMVLSVGAVSRPVIWSANLVVVPAHKVGLFMGARSWIENVVVVLSSTGFAMIYSVTVESLPSLTFVIAAGIYTLSVGSSMFLRS